MNTPVAMIFFNRPEQFRRVFKEVEKAKPTQLFLIQDGARDNHPDDIKGIMACRMICETITWDCEVHRNYSEQNLGCGMRVSSGISWAFSYVDRLIIFEDDTLPSQSWFPFCEELLERYLNDERIGLITGVNHVGKYNAGGQSYFFASCGSIAGWATWKRVWDNYDYDVTFCDNEYYIDCLSRTLYPRWKTKQIIRQLKKLREYAKTGIKRKSWSGPFGFSVMLNSQLIIVPSVNLITNIGVGPEATNGGTSKAIMPKKLRGIFDAPAFEMPFPLTHPQFIIEDRYYNDRWQEVMNGGNSCFRRLFRRIDIFVRILLVKYLKILK